MTDTSVSDGTLHQQKVQDLEAEMKLLNWHKLANESALQAALIRTKSIRRSDLASAPHSERAVRSERAEQLQRVMEEENAKPLKVDRDFITKYEEEERQGKLQISKEIEQRMECLQKVKDKLEQKDITWTRKKRCKEVRGQLLAEKRDLASKGSIHLMAKREEQQQYGDADDADGSETDTKDQLVETGSLEVRNKNNPPALRSLNQLITLEGRIRALEEGEHLDNNLESALSSSKHRQYTPSLKRHSPFVPSSRVSVPARNPRTKLSFCKRRTDSRPGYPARQYYAVRVKEEKAKSRPNYGRGGETRSRVSAQIRPSSSVASTANSSLSKEKRRHDLTHQRRTSGVRKTKQGSYQGFKTGNAHLREFHKIRDGHNRRKDAMRYESVKMLQSGTCSPTKTRAKTAPKNRWSFGRTAKTKILGSVVDSRPMTKGRSLHSKRSKKIATNGTRSSQAEHLSARNSVQFSTLTERSRGNKTLPSGKKNMSNKHFYRNVNPRPPLALSEHESNNQNMLSSQYKHYQTKKASSFRNKTSPRHKIKLSATNLGGSGFQAVRSRIRRMTKL
eukprot:CAMPEP_0194370206 /NCGR_PEP_ID=MMETSP0174-20130528/18486_1 /TAXON_ID=216777 /ORGANISM="Proboscia alata, Strain PI-D3" /LENGTH=561 /DNA_ID=CAMNT_0039147515 /DNA_START=90 /DNA_END=1775 /DNA_ORIENTATION=+